MREEWGLKNLWLDSSDLPDSCFKTLNQMMGKEQRMRNEGDEENQQVELRGAMKLPLL